MSAAQTATAVDAFTAAVIRNAVVAITREMKTNLMRTAYSSIIYEAADFTVGLFDADGHTISLGLGLPMFIRGLSDAIKAKIAPWGKENITPGDILLTNDGYVMGSHLNHMIFTLLVKIFKAGRQDPELTAILRANCRLPDRAMGDFRAQIAAIRTGSAASPNSSSATAPRRSQRASSSSSSRVNAWRVPPCARSRTMRMRPSPLWTTMA
jgi:N-methylhydantoinase B